MEEGRVLTLDEHELHHARSHRLRAGSRALGIDGCGAEVPLVLERVERRSLTVRVTGPGHRVPRPGTPGAPLPWVELLISWPRRSRADAMLSSLVQLGAASIGALATERRGPEPLPDAPPARWTSIAFEALKQSGRLWLPQFSGAVPLDEALSRPGPTAYLDLEEAAPLPGWLAAQPTGTPEEPLRLLVGPEGGWSPAERERLRANSTPLSLGPHTLRIETAAVAAMSCIAAAWSVAHDGDGPSGT